jgi:lipoprotein NlpD
MNAGIAAACITCRCPEARAPFVLALCGALLYGCTGAPVPVSEREVSEYRKPASTAPAVPRNPAPVVNAPADAKPPGSNAPSVAPPPKSAARPGEGLEEGDWRPDTYTVKRGDTLFSIALDHGLDYKELAAWNQLADANVIKVGQTLKLRAPPGWKTESADTDEVIARPLAASPPLESQPLEPPVAPKNSPKGIKLPYSDEALAQLTRDPAVVPSLDAKPAAPEPKPPPKAVVAPEPRSAPDPKPIPIPEPAAKPAPAVKVEPMAAKPAPKLDDKPFDQTLQWSWPANGKLVHAFNQGSNPKGVAIRGTPGQPVFATASGKVVYSGSGLRGYGKLIIIKHNNTYLSVYAHNREILVKEGERVSRGQKIAEMGSDSADGVALHFEIRRLGKPVDPMKFLPAEGA